MSHPRRPVHSTDAHPHVHGRHRLGRFNARLAVVLTNAAGTMYCAYVFLALAFVALPAAIAQGSPTILINWLSSNCLQLVLLPVILVGQRIISATQDAQAAADHAILSKLDAILGRLEPVSDDELALVRSRLGRGGDGR